jgi:hypothetical protein
MGSFFSGKCEGLPPLIYTIPKESRLPHREEEDVARLIGVCLKN